MAAGFPVGDLRPPVVVIMVSTTSTATNFASINSTGYLDGNSGFFGRAEPPPLLDDDLRVLTLADRRRAFRAWLQIKCRRTPRRTPGQGSSGRNDGPQSGLVHPHTKRWRSRALGKRPSAIASG